MSTNRDCRALRARRRGLSLPLTMIALSTSLVVTLAFTQTQTMLLLVARNASRDDLALEAAAIGADVALHEMQQPDWGGVTVSLSRTVADDSDGHRSFEVTYEPWRADDGEPTVEGALRVVIRSTGRWVDADDPAHVVERVVESVAELRPRLPGRIVTAVDSETVDDLAPNPGDYDLIREYALFAGGGSDSLVLDPCDRIDGRVWLYDRLRLYRDPQWSGSVRRTMLDSIGANLVVDGLPLATHPFGSLGVEAGLAQIEFYSQPASDVQDDLSRVRTTWDTASRRLQLPQVDPEQWKTYRLYDGGFEYHAEVVGNDLGGVTLRPTPENPLGIFYADGSVRLWDDVTVQGTLVSRDEVQVLGDRVFLASFDGRVAGGGAVLPALEGWPRLPAIVAKRLFVDRTMQASIDGAVIVEDRFYGAGGDYELEAVTSVDVSGTAKVDPGDQPFSNVKLNGAVDTSGIDGSGRFAIRLGDGPSATWHAIVGVEGTKLTVAGEAEPGTVVPFRIRPGRRSYFDLRGPLAGREHDVNRPDGWAVPTFLDWDVFKTDWETENASRALLGLRKIPFVSWLADPLNFIGWLFPLNAYGLPLEPTFQVQHRGGVDQAWSPPLFRPFDVVDDSDPEADHAGYRWELRSWRIVR